MSLPRLHSLFFPAAIGAIVLLGGSFALAAWLERGACNLCHTLQGVLAAYTTLSVLALFHAARPRVERRYAQGLLLCAGLGAWLAARQVWLQGHVIEGSICQLPLTDAAVWPSLQWLQQALMGAPTCTPIRWSFLDLTLPEWSLLAFLGLACLPLSYLLGRRFRALTQPSF